MLDGPATGSSGSTEKRNSFEFATRMASYSAIKMKKTTACKQMMESLVSSIIDLQSVKLAIPARVVIGTLGISPFILAFCQS